MRAFFSLIILCVTGFFTPLMAAPVPYELVLKQSKVVFFYDLSGTQTRGQFPVSEADVMIDLRDVRRSSLDVHIATKQVRTADPLVMLAIGGKGLLATGAYPQARFVSTRVVPSKDGVVVEGDLTLKGVTLPVSLRAGFMRRQDAPTDNSELILWVSGDVSRTAFGVSGFPEIVGDIIQLNFSVSLKRAK